MALKGLDIKLPRIGKIGPRTKGNHGAKTPHLLAVAAAAAEKNQHLEKLSLEKLLGEILSVFVEANS